MIGFAGTGLTSPVPGTFVRAGSEGQTESDQPAPSGNERGRDDHQPRQKSWCSRSRALINIGSLESAHARARAVDRCRVSSQIDFVRARLLLPRIRGWRSSWLRVD
jgi:hypothetical protein